MKLVNHLILALMALCLGTVFFSPVAKAEKLEKSAPKVSVAALHPILGDLARRIGGEYVEVVDLLKANGNLHAFEPSTEDVLQAGKASLVFASGKKIEPYLPKLTDALPKGVKIVDVGKGIPDVLISPENEGSVCCEDHDNEEGEKGHDHNHGHSHDHHEAVDPHWWHSMDNIKKASQVIAKELSLQAPERKEAFLKNREEILRECDRLTAWGKRQIMKVPQEGRTLVVGHAAFGHLCKELGFRQIAVQGIAREDEGSGQRLAEKLKELRSLKPRAVFPEYQSNPKVLDEIAKTLGIKTAKPLISDGTAPEAHTFDKMYEYNINAITNALTGDDVETKD